ncbi:MAG: SDR family oxidoreductase [Candidatus Diapherotrites archaeon]
MRKLEGKVALVTGGCRGLGRHISLLLARHGADVAIVGLDKGRLAATGRELSVLGSEALACRCDVRSLKDITAATKKISKRFGRVDILVNNAGLANKQTLDEISHGEIDNIIDTNLSGLIHMTKAVLPLMPKQKGSVIVNVSSLAGRIAVPRHSVYGATKFGVAGFTQSLAKDLKKTGVRVYALCPMGIDTEMARVFEPGYEKLRDNGLLLGPESVAEKAVALCMPSCGKRTGSLVNVMNYRALLLRPEKLLRALP